MDLLSIGPLAVRALMDDTTDPRVLRALVALEAAALADDDDARCEAVAGLFDVLVLEQGVGL